MRRSTLSLLSIPLLLGLMGASCSTAPTKPVIPAVVKVPVKVYVEVPSELSKDCEAVPKTKQDVDEAVRLANARAESIAECTKRMRAIRALPVTPP